jgi:hypothetical protein
MVDQEIHRRLTNAGRTVTPRERHALPDRPTRQAGRLASALVVSAALGILLLQVSAAHEAYPAAAGLGSGSWLLVLAAGL